MGCHTIYSICRDAGFTEICECDKEKTDIMTLLANVLRHIYEKHEKYINKHYKEYPARLCMYKPLVIKELEKIAECFRECRNHNPDDEDDIKYLKERCPKHIICNKDYIADLYRINGHTIRNPDILIVKGKMVTVIIEEKKYGKQNHREFTEQITNSYEYLPQELRTSCTFMVYAPRGGGTLPKGYTKHQTLLILGRESKGRKGFLAFGIPVIVLERDILSYVFKRKHK